MNKDALVGTQIREYEIIESIGKGGMGAVYKARHVLLQKERAIKVIQSFLAGDQVHRDRFIREARILSELNHPNLVQLYEFGTLDENTLFMVMEFVRGESVLNGCSESERSQFRNRSASSARQRPACIARTQKESFIVIFLRTT